MIVNDDQRLAMEFIATVNRGGYRPTAGEINEYRLRPDPKPARKGKLIRAEVPGTPERRVRVGGSSAFDLYGPAFKNFSSNLSSISETLNKSMALYNTGNVSAVLSAIEAVNRATRIGAAGIGLPGVEYKTIPGTPGTPAEYGPEKEPEKFLAHLRRLGWIERNSRKRYSVTLLGSALLDADVDGDDYDESSVIVLSKENELAYTQVLGAIGGCGHALVVDAYLSAEALSHILAHTNATRFLVNLKSYPSRLSELSVLVGSAAPNDDGVVRELRQAEFHDRYLIGEDQIYSLTASINGVGKRATALMYEMPDTAARAIRSEIEDLWTHAKVLSRGLELVQPDDEPEPGRAVREDEGKFHHDGCDVKHKSERAAKNCTKGT